MGVITPHYQVRDDGDSIFCLGLVNTSEQISLVVDASTRGNAGRFINSSSSKREANCRAEIGMFEPLSDPAEPAIVIVATKNIKPGT